MIYDGILFFISLLCYLLAQYYVAQADVKCFTYENDGSMVYSVYFLLVG